MAKMQQNWGAFVLELLASLIFLGVLFGNQGAITAQGAGGVLGGAGGFWAPVFIGGAIISAIALFFASFGQVTGMSGPRFNMMGLATAELAGLTLIALTWTPAGNVWEGATVVAVIVGFLGTWIAASSKR